VDRYLTFVLHSHIPYVVGHGTWPHGMDWLYEAAAETYLPLLGVLRRLIAEGISPGITIGMTPVLAEQLTMPVFAAGLAEYLKMKVDAARRDIAYFEKTGNAVLAGLAEHWADWYERTGEAFVGQGGGDIIGSFRSLQDQGHLEVVTSAATHAYFPLLSRDESISAQAAQGCLSYRKHFGREARGFWLPECAYRPGYAWAAPFGGRPAVERRGVDELLAAQGLGHFFIPAHLLRGGTSRGVYEERFPALRRLWEKAYAEPGGEGRASSPPRSCYSAYRVDPSGLSVLARDEVSGGQVWSRTLGYPGDGAYLEFHKKHFPGGMRYWRITSAESDLADKDPYDPNEVRARLESHARHFAQLIEGLLRVEGRRVVVALFDTELFGHWWFEGPEWLYLVLKKLSGSPVRAVTSRECLERLGPGEMIRLPEGSWGEGGFHSVWLNRDTAWIWRKIYQAEERVLGLGREVWDRRARLGRQLMREKFLLESSDWPFLISTWAARDYAAQRAAEHFDRLANLCRWMEKPSPLGRAEEALLASWEVEDGLFPEVVGPRGEAPAGAANGDGA
jgi:1,4-alpha-glucan branching enzyme